jgi:electron transfer flavoprotein alpha subunit
MNQNRSAPSPNKVTEGLARSKAAVVAWKSSMTDAMTRGGTIGADKAEAITQLRRATEELEADLASVLNELQTALAQAGALELQAMTAVQRGDDVAARSAILEREPVAAACEQLEADAKVIRAMLAECAIVLADQST